MSTVWIKWVLNTLLRVIIWDLLSGRKDEESYFLKRAAYNDSLPKQCIILFCKHLAFITVYVYVGLKSRLEN